MDYITENVKLLHGDCLEVLKELPDNSVDSVVADPPYGLAFMGKKWDYDVPSVDIWRECLRVLKPGGHLLSFAGSRTYHRMTVAIEDAGFEIRDQIMWVYGCLDEQTEVATSDGVKPYHQTKAGDTVLCYNPDNGEYSYQPILEVVEYDYSDTAYRLVGDFGEQVVSRNHRCIVERDGSEAFMLAETLECEARVPILEDLPALQQAVTEAQQGIRAWGGHRTTVVRVVPFHYTGKVWCLRVPTGAFVAVRNGVAFPTGNSGFPKSLDVSRAIDKAAGAEREVTREGQTKAPEDAGKFDSASSTARERRDTPATDAARQWQGFGSALKPAHEPICVARKPLIGTIAANVLAHGTGAINIDGCRVGDDVLPAQVRGVTRMGTLEGADGNETPERVGRWPANFIHDGSEEVTGLLGDAARFFKQCEVTDTEWLEKLSPALIAGNSLSLQSLADAIAQSDAAILALPEDSQLSVSTAVSTSVTQSESRLIAEAVITAMPSIVSAFLRGQQQKRLSLSLNHVSVAARRMPTGTTTITASLSKSDGSAASITFNITPKNLGAGGKGCVPSLTRFIYCAKASRKERDEGLDGFDLRVAGGMAGRADGSMGSVTLGRNHHPTVKPTDLMRYLCRLVTPPGGVVLDPFLGSGSTGVAALAEGFRFVGIEREAEYMAIATARIRKAAEAQ